MLRAAAVLLVAALPGSVAASPAPTRLLALLADRTLLVADLGRGAVLSSTSLGPPQPIVRFGGDLVGRSPNGRATYVLVPGAKLAVLDGSSLAVKRRVALPSGVAFRSLAVGPRSGRLISRATRSGRRRST